MRKESSLFRPITRHRPSILAGPCAQSAPGLAFKFKLLNRRKESSPLSQRGFLPISKMTPPSGLRWFGAKSPTSSWLKIFCAEKKFSTREWCFPQEQQVLAVYASPRWECCRTQATVQHSRLYCRECPTGALSMFFVLPNFPSPSMPPLRGCAIIMGFPALSFKEIWASIPAVDVQLH